MWRWGAWAVVGLVASGCAGQPATPEQRAQGERRLLQPFLAAREVGCGELLVELTGNFHGNVGQPAVDRSRHRVTRETGDGYVDQVWTNAAGTADAAFALTIGEPPQLTERGLVRGAETRFRVVNQVRLRIYEDRRPLTLNAVAGGSFVFVKEAGGTPREVPRFAIVDGRVEGP